MNATSAPWTNMGATEYPGSACPVATRFIRNVETSLNASQRTELRALLPELDGTRDPGATQPRLEWLAERALIKWAVEALRANGGRVMAKAIESEPSLERAQALAQMAAGEIRTSVPARQWAAGRTASEAAKSLMGVQREDPLDRPAGAVFAAQALLQWATATGRDATTETAQTVRTMLNIPVEAPAARN